MTKEQQLVNQIAALSGELHKVRKTTILRCPFCHKGTQIYKLVVSQLKYYTIEDWEFAADFHITCPKCSHMTRYFDKNDKNFQLVLRLLSYFGWRTTHEI